MSGFPQGSVIGPCLANFTLNGLEEISSPTQRTAIDYEKSKANHYDEHYKPGQSLVRKTLVQRAYRYADEVVIVSNDEGELSLARIRIEYWLKLRGLTLNAEKSSLKK